jgi:hypothetical protein
MLPFPDVVNFFPHELPSLSGGSFAFSSVFTSPFHGLFFRHLNLLNGFSSKPSLVPRLNATNQENDVKVLDGQANSLGALRFLRLNNSSESLFTNLPDAAAI